MGAALCAALARHRGGLRSCRCRALPAAPLPPRAPPGQKPWQTGSLAGSRTLSRPLTQEPRSALSQSASEACESLRPFTSAVAVMAGARAAVAALVVMLLASAAGPTAAAAPERSLQQQASAGQATLHAALMRQLWGNAVVA